jgi:ATP-dependent Lhr-like helicase
VILPAEDELAEPHRGASRAISQSFSLIMPRNCYRYPEIRHHGGLLIDAIAGRPAHQHFLAAFLREAGFQPSPRGFHVRYVAPER